MSEPPPLTPSPVPGAERTLLAELRDESGHWLRPALAEPGDPRSSLVGDRALVAIIDSGVLAEHPTIAAALDQESLDVTGEGPEDRIGHGTYVALALLAQTPDARILSIKAVGSDGVGDRIQLLRALELAFERGADILNLSLGSYDPDCVGDCILCSAVGSLAAAGLIVLAAAGNVPGRTDCPAKAGTFNETAISVAAMDPATGKTAWYSGVGEFLFSPGSFRMVPV